MHRKLRIVPATCRPTRPVSLHAAMAALALCAAAGSAHAQAGIDVAIDHAKVLKIARAAETVIIGNPSIVDVTVHDSETLVLTGRSYGTTNLVILDRDGQSIIDEEVAVSGAEEGTIRIFRQAERTTYSCMPQCEPTVTIGDTGLAFESAAYQFQKRQSMATGAKD